MHMLTITNSRSVPFAKSKSKKVKMLQTVVRMVQGAE